jgi:hypothetical protein
VLHFKFGKTPQRNTCGVRFFKGLVQGPNCRCSRISTKNKWGLPSAAWLRRLVNVRGGFPAAVLNLKGWSLDNGSI